MNLKKTSIPAIFLLFAGHSLFAQGPIEVGHSIIMTVASRPVQKNVYTVGTYVNGTWFLSIGNNNTFSIYALDTQSNLVLDNNNPLIPNNQQIYLRNIYSTSTNLYFSTTPSEILHPTFFKYDWRQRSLSRQLSPGDKIKIKFEDNIADAEIISRNHALIEKGGSEIAILKLKINQIESFGLYRVGISPLENLIHIPASIGNAAYFWPFSWDGNWLTYISTNPPGLARYSKNGQLERITYDSQIIDGETVSGQETSSFDLDPVTNEFIYGYKLADGRSRFARISNGQINVFYRNDNAQIQPDFRFRSFMFGAPYFFDLVSLPSSKTGIALLGPNNDMRVVTPDGILPDGNPSPGFAPYLPVANLSNGCGALIASGDTLWRAEVPYVKEYPKQAIPAGLPITIKGCNLGGYQGLSTKIIDQDDRSLAISLATADSVTFVAPFYEGTYSLKLTVGKVEALPFNISVVGPPQPPPRIDSITPATNVAGSVAAGGFMTVLGKDFCSNQAYTATNTPWPTTLGDAKLIVDAATVLPLHYVGPSGDSKNCQINAQLPWETNSGTHTANISVVSPSGKVLVSQPFLFESVLIRPTFFSAPPAYPVLLQIYDRGYSLMSDLNPARPGEVLIGYADGFGKTSPPMLTGQASSSQGGFSEVRASVSAYLNSCVQNQNICNSTPAEVLWAVSYPQSPAGYMIAIRIPDIVIENNKTYYLSIWVDKIAAQDMKLFLEK
ncbi:MAG TPA: hypothetical protein VJH71_00010 [Candidatus Paceibacterota bacterium]